MEEQGSKSEDAICEVFSDLAKKGTLPGMDIVNVQGKVSSNNGQGV